MVRAIHSNDAILVDDLPTAAEREQKKLNKSARAASREANKQANNDQVNEEMEDDTMMDDDNQEVPPEVSEKEK